MDTYDFTYKFVDIPNWQQVAKEVEKRIPTNLYEIHGFLDVEPHVLLPAKGLIDLIKYFSPLNNLRQFAVVNLLPGKSVDDFPIHIDNIDYPVVLNIPVYNCDKVPTKFYKFKREIQLQSFQMYTENNREIINYQYCPPHLMEEIDSFCLSEPAFINNWIPHTAINLTDDRRTMFNIRFKRPIDPKFYT